MSGSLAVSIGEGLTLLVALLHLWFMILEMFLWRKPIGLKTFRLTPEFAESSAALASNQGLYNGFLAAGLIWSVCVGNPEFAHSLSLFFLSCVAVAGIFGAFTVNKRIFVVQSVPALLAIAARMLAS